MFYAHELAREDFAFLTSQALDDDLPDVIGLLDDGDGGDVGRAGVERHARGLSRAERHEGAVLPRHTRRAGGCGIKGPPAA
jgi:hypothetical protein